MEDLPLFRRRLLDWYRTEKRDLDWRQTRDPYCIWLSEIMLQQTRVAAVIPYYRRFVARFPTVQHLARARSAAVLRHWAGLGYYSRARNLHLAAKAAILRHDGRFPTQLTDALALPGVGSYTAAAVLSIAYDAPLAVLDGNVARVLARLGAIRGNLRRPALWRRLGTTATRLLDASAPGTWNQAMMELGATVCTPQAPRCGVCPVARWCRARTQGVAAELPTARLKPAKMRMTLAAAVLLDPRGRTLLLREKEADGALFSRLWQFPAVISAASGRTGKMRAQISAQAAQRKLAQHLERKFGICVQLRALPAAKHAVTFREIRLVPYFAQVRELPKISGTQTPKLTELDRLPVSSATKKIAAAVLRLLSEGERSGVAR